MSTPRGPVDPYEPLPPELNPRRGSEPRHAGRPREGWAGQPHGRDLLRDPNPYRGQSGDPSRDPYLRSAPPGNSFRPVATGGGSGLPPRRRTKGQIAALVAKVIAAALSVTVLAASGLLWFYYRNFDAKVQRVNAIGATTVQDIDGKDQNLLLVGSDDRSTATPEELRALGTQMDPGKNTDTMMLVHVPADGRKATAVSFPRDLWVNIPGFGKGKLNSAYADGAYGEGGKPNPDRGRQLLVRTISELSGLKIDHYVEVDLLGFYRITEAIGGVEVCLKAAQKEKDSGINLPAGKSTIQGTQALAFVRQRKGLPRGDLDRIVRQQYFLGATFRKVTSFGVLGNPIKLGRLLDKIGRSLRMDPGLKPLDLARQMRNLAAGNVQFMTVPNKGTANIGGASVVLPDEDKFPAFFKTFTSGSSNGTTAAKTVPRSQVAVSVLNGAGRGGLAAQTGNQLRAAGFAVQTPGNTSRQAATEIRYGSGKEAQARTLAAVVPGAQLRQQDGLGDTVQLVLGTNFGGIKAGGSGSSGGSGASGGSPASGSPASPGNQPSRSAADAGCIN